MNRFQALRCLPRNRSLFTVCEDGDQIDQILDRKFSSISKLLIVPNHTDGSAAYRMVMQERKLTVDSEVKELVG